jgi:hypothetical protein
MSENKNMILAVFNDIDPAAHAVEKLRAFGVADDQLSVISGIPVSEAIMGRPHQWSNVPRLAGGGALAGFILGAFFAFGTPLMYPISVGGQSLFPVPPSIVAIFEMTMLGMLLSTFLGVFLDSHFPKYAPMEYVPEISDGKIAILFNCPAGQEDQIEKAMNALGVESFKAAEAQEL